MGLIDWGIVVALLVILTGMAIYTRKHTQSVADFLAANRCAGRYLVSVSQGIAGVGAISIVAGFEMFYNAGFTAAWWRLIFTVTTTIMFISGWVVYRYRQTRAFTLAQFLEMRYSRRFRIFAGFLAWFAGIVNFGIFPAVGARFFMFFCGFPDTMLTYALIMLVLLSFSLFFTFLGGQIAVIVTDFIQGTFCNIMFVVIAVVVLSMFSWPQIMEALASAPTQESMINPFQTQKAEDFNVWFYLIMAFTFFYGGGIVWQGSQGYHVSALNAHEARMGKILVGWRILALDLFMMILPIAAFTFMHHPEFAEEAAKARQVISGIDNPQIQEQVKTTVPVRIFLPTGFLGGLAAVMLAAFISTHDTYMHSWGSIFIQDFIMPFRKKPLPPKKHMFLLRASIFGVAAFIFLFSLVFRQTEYILMFFHITGAIFVGGAGAAVIGGLYWRKGTIAAAWSAMITGSTLAVSAVIIRQINQSYPEFFLSIPYVGKGLDLIASQNGTVLSFIAAVSAIFVYILVSLLTCKEDYNLDKMLHRGKYAVHEHEDRQANLPVTGIRAIIGMGSEFNLRDKILYIASMAWTFLLIAVFVFGTIYNLTHDVKNESWMIFWKYYVWIILGLSAITTLWFTFGGLKDLFKMFRLLKSVRRNDLDDGTVVDDHNLGEVPGEGENVNDN